MTPQERIDAIDQLLRKVEAMPQSGPCIQCKWSRKVEYDSISECRHPVAVLYLRAKAASPGATIAYPTLPQMRRPDGYCGPEGLLWERPILFRPFWAQPTMDRQFFLSFPQILGAVTVLIFATAALAGAFA